MSKIKQIHTDIDNLKNCKKVFCVVYTKDALGQYGFMGNIMFGVNTMQDYRDFGIDDDEIKLIDALGIGENHEIDDLGFGLPCVRIK